MPMRLLITSFLTPAIILHAKGLHSVLVGLISFDRLDSLGFGPDIS